MGLESIGSVGGELLAAGIKGLFDVGATIFQKPVSHARTERNAARLKITALI